MQLITFRAFPGKHNVSFLIVSNTETVGTITYHRVKFIKDCVGKMWIIPQPKYCILI